MRKKKPEDFKSKFEVLIWKQLTNAKRIKGIKDTTYEEDRINYSIPASYCPDFTIHFEDARTTYIETKGYLRPEDKRKMIAVKQSNPDLDIRIVFQKDNKFPRSKMTYGMWAEKYGFPWAVGEIPREWFT